MSGSYLKNNDHLTTKHAQNTVYELRTAGLENNSKTGA